MLLAPVGYVSFIERTFDFTDPDHLSVLGFGYLWLVLRVSVTIEPHPDLILIHLSHLVRRSTNRPVVGVVVGVQNLRLDVKVVAFLVCSEVCPDARPECPV